MPVSRRTYIRRRITVFGGLGLGLLLALYLPLTLLAPLPSASAVPVSTTAATNAEIDLAWPTFGSSAIGAVGFPGILASHGSQKPRTIASITKIITSLVVLSKKPLDTDSSGVASDGPTITMTAADTANYHSYLARNGEVKPVTIGLTLTERQLLQVVLIASANNYAETMATWAFGSNSAFLTAATAWLEAKGLTHTSLSDATGMNPANKSTTTDLVALGKIALADPVVSSIVSMKSVTLPYIGTIVNTNKLLGTSGVTGIKTGTLPEAGSCLLFASKIHIDGHDVTIVGVVLGGPDHPTLDAAIRRLLASATPGFRVLPVVAAGEEFFRYSTPWGQSASAVAQKDASTLTWAGTPVSVSARADPVRDGRAGDRVGLVSVIVGATTVTVPLTLDAAVTDPGPWWRLVHPFG